MPGQSSENFGEKVKLRQYIFAYSGFRPAVLFRQYTVTHINLKAILIRRTSGRRLGTFIKSSAFSYRGEFDKKTTFTIFFHYTHIHLNATLILRKSWRSLDNFQYSHVLTEIGGIGKKCNFILFTSV